MSYLYETHLHTDECSACAHTPARDYVQFYLEQGFKGIIVTDHFYRSVCYVPDQSAPWRRQMDEYCRGYENALNEGLKRGLDVFFGLEYSFGGDEALVYGIDKQWLYEHPDMGTWSRRKLFDEVDAAGGCVVHAHPFRVRSYTTHIWLNSNVHAIEAFNAGNNPQDDLYGIAFAKQFGLPATAGSDIHQIAQYRPERLYGVAFDKPWTSIVDYVKAIRTKDPFNLHFELGRDQGKREPLACEWTYLDRCEQPAHWSPDEWGKLNL